MSLLTKFDGITRPRFIETGTHMGNTLQYAAEVFPECLSIEWNQDLFRKAQERFASQPHVKLFQGNSPVVLAQIIDPEIPTTFWLDAHYFGNGDSISPYGQCPLKAELEIIASRPWKTKPIILIDDAHMFDDSIPHPGSKYPFWTSNESGYDIYVRRQWPRIAELDEVMAGYERSMFSGDECIIRYDDGDGRQ